MSDPRDIPLSAVTGRQAFAVLAREHHRGLLVFARALCGNHATSADLVQDAFVTAWRNLDRFDTTRDFGAWLRGIVRNKRRVKTSSPAASTAWCLPPMAISTSASPARAS